MIDTIRYLFKTLVRFPLINLFTLLVKDVVFTWNPTCQEAFEAIKKILVTTPILRGPNWELPFHIYTNASDSSMGVVFTTLARTSLVQR